MITADLHTHTLYSHGKDTPADMFAAAQAKGITLYGFTEHSPRPLGYDYTREYREHLTRHYPDYVREVRELQTQHPGQVLLGMEMDWMEKELPFIQTSIHAYDFDYLIGSVHFLQHWGYDDTIADWKNLTPAQCAQHYEAYFRTLRRMVESGLFQIAGHLDLIKIFSVDTFRAWLDVDAHMALVRDVLLALRDAGMAMEISSAGLRKPCKEIYPGPKIMALAAEIGVDICLSSDAHNVHDVANAFDQLEAYARSYGYDHSVWFCKGQRFERPFDA